MPTVKTIEIDETRCNGCGQCVQACHEGVIALVNGKAKVVRPDFCDGLGSCVPSCPQGAIRLVEKAVTGCPHEVTHRTAPHWPLQIALISPLHSFPEKELVIAADCTAFATPSFHELLGGRRVLIACPKLDSNIAGYIEKLAAIFRHNNLQSVAVFRMEVPCCFGIVRLVEEAIRSSGKNIELRVTTVSVEGKIGETAETFPLKTPIKEGTGENNLLVP